MTHLIFSQALLLSLISTASAAQSIERDAGNMPRCIADQKHADDGLLLHWDSENFYQRKVQIIRLSDFRAYSKLPRYELGCKNWESFSKLASNRANWRADHRAVEINNQVLSKDSSVPDALEQIRYGASTYRVEATAKEFLASHPIENFTRQTNLELTKAYGVGFTAEVYREWVESKPANEKFREHIQKNLQVTSVEDADRPSLATQLNKVTIWIAKGYMQSPQNDRIQGLLDDLKSFGVKTSTFEINPTGSILENADKIEAQLKNILSTNQKIIVAGASKGTPELLTALSRFSESEVFGKIIAVVNLSGTVEGSFLVDAAQKFPFNKLAHFFLKQEAKKTNMKIDSLDGLYDMSSQGLARIHQKIKLPTNLSYFNLIGVLNDFGFANDPAIRGLQEKLSAERLPFHGANDGYVEYPGTAIPATWVPRLYEVVFQASHVLLDGKFEGLDLTKQDERKLMVDAIFRSIADFSKNSSEGIQ